MNSKSPEKQTSLRVAVPYYGSLIHPQTGMANIYFLADVDLGKQSTLALQMRVWSRDKQPKLSTWLKDQKVTGLLCRDCYSPHLLSLESEGLWVYSDATGDAEEIVAQWLHHRAIA